MSNATQDNQRGTKNNGVSDTEFGHSVESNAQIADAETLASGTDDGEILNEYRLEPVAPPTDYRWDNAPGRGRFWSRHGRLATPALSPPDMKATFSKPNRFLAKM